MRAALYDRYGSADELRVGSLDDPRPRAGEVLVKVRAAALNPKDVIVRSGRFRWVARGPFPRSCGYDFAGTVEAHGPGVDLPPVGEAVFGMINGMLGRTCADSLVVSAQELAIKPANVSFLEAASVPLAALTALQAIRDHGLARSGSRLLINGASGGVGTLAIQIAKLMGAEVKAVCSSRNQDLCRSLGADLVLPYDELDPLAELKDVDLFFDIFGNRSYGRVRHLLSADGRYVTTVPKPRILFDRLRTVFAAQRASMVVVHSIGRDLELIAGWLADGCLRPVVDRSLALAEIADGHRYLQTKRARGKVVIEIGDPGPPDG